MINRFFTNYNRRTLIIALIHITLKVYLEITVLVNILVLRVINGGLTLSLEVVLKVFLKGRSIVNLSSSL